ncbi:DNA cross-link repair 1A protein-like [Liolophura sinensis]|uniref:DNA cross-link repair 1A protein-like n=1 Tax=Liolophura sinensis TaxID=3198878 RepID=UPI003159198C
MMMEDEEDEKIWGYRSLRRKRRSVDPQEENIKKGKALSEKQPQKKTSAKKSPANHRKTTQSSPVSKDKVSPKRPKYEGFCPMCQMPLCLLIIDSPSSHVTECMDRSQGPEEECSAGISCNNTVQSHYRNYKHSRLAGHRAGHEAGENQKFGGCTTLDICSPDSREFTQLSTTKSSSNSCGRSRSTVVSDFNKSSTDSTKRSVKKTTSTSKLSCSKQQSLQTKKRSSKKSSKIKKNRSEGDLGFFKKFSKENICTSTKEKVLKRRLDYETPDRLSVPGVYIIDDEDSNTKPNVTKDENQKVEELDEFLDDEDRDISDMLADALGSDSDIDRIDEDENVDNINGKMKNDDCGVKEEKFANSEVKMTLTPAEDEDSCGSVDFIQHLLDAENGGISHAESNAVKDDKQCNASLSKTQGLLSGGGNSKAAKKSAMGGKGETGKKGGRETTLHSKQQSGEVTGKRHSFSSEVKSLSQCSEVEVVFASPSEKSDHAAHSSPPKATTAASKQSSLLSFFQPKGGSRRSEKNTSVNKNVLKPEVAEKWPARELVSTIKSETNKINKSSVTGPKSAAIKSGFDSDQSNSSTGFERKKPTRNCPFYKKIPGTPFTVDAFCYGSVPECTAYFLSHFHYDHYRGLAKSFKHPIYCSKITGNLVRSKLYVQPEYIHTIPLDTPTVICGVEVTFMEANHCPGSVLILFKLKDGTNLLHTGDFRAHRSMEEYSPIVKNKIHTLYLDTTYCDPTYTFAEQQEVIDVAVSLVMDAMSKNPNTLVVCGSYTIGKERVFTAIAKALDCKIAVTREKKRVLDCLEDPYLNEAVTLSWSEARVHILPMGSLNLKKLHEHLQDNPRFEGIIALSPTGWSHSNKVPSLQHIKPKASRNGVTIYGIPYSEHSSFLELKRFVQFLKADKILPTVNNGNPSSRKKMEAIFEEWMTELSTPGKRKSTPRQKTLATFLRSSQE